MQSLLSSMLPTAGIVYAHLFENRRAGLERDVFWSFTVYFPPITVDGDSWDVSFTAEWLSWELRSSPDINNLTLSNLKNPALVEASLYIFAAHQPMRLKVLTLQRQSSTQLLLTAAVDGHLENLHGESVGPIRLAFTTPLVFSGIYVLPANLETHPTTPERAAAELAEFVDVRDFQPPVWDDFRFRFTPCDV